MIKENSNIDGWVLGSQSVPSESSSQFSAASRRVQWSQQPVGETWLCWSQSLSFLNKHFPFWNNYLTIYRKHQLLQSKSLIIWKGISLKLFSPLFKAAASPLLPGLYMPVNSVIKGTRSAHTEIIWISLCSPPPPHGFWDYVCNHNPQDFGNHLPISLPPSWFSVEQKETCLLPGRKFRSYWATF